LPTVHRRASGPTVSATHRTIGPAYHRHARRTSRTTAIAPSPHRTIAPAHHRHAHPTRPTPAPAPHRPRTRAPPPPPPSPRPATPPSTAAPPHRPRPAHPPHAPPNHRATATAPQPRASRSQDGDWPCESRLPCPTHARDLPCARADDLPPPSFDPPTER